MNVTVNSILPLSSGIVSLIFTLAVLGRYLKRKGSHLLLWGIGLAMYSVGTLSEAFVGTFGWNETAFRLWYMCGAMLTAAWLGQGTVYLIAPKRASHILLAILLLGSLYGVFKIFSTQLDPDLMPGSQLSGHAITTGGVRVLTPFFNVYGVLTLVGGAVYSALVYFRKRIMPQRVVGNVLIAVGAMSPAIGGSLSRLGATEFLYLSEFIGAILMYAGFLTATMTVKVEAKETAQA